VSRERAVIPELPSRLPGIAEVDIGHRADHLPDGPAVNLAEKDVDRRAARGCPQEQAGSLGVPPGDATILAHRHRTIGDGTAGSIHAGGGELERPAVGISEIGLATLGYLSRHRAPPASQAVSLGYLWATRSVYRQRKAEKNINAPRAVSA